MDYKSDDRAVLTLDAGGTNFVFSAIRGGEEVVTPITKPSNADNLDRCMNTLVEGFTEIMQKLSQEPVAISFAFPGPADYPNGIIGDLPNFPAFRGGVAMGPFLEEKFGLPVFINNDGDLFAYGEALVGMLPKINNDLKNAGCKRQYKNLVGLTLGTGFGGGLVIDNRLLIGDNSIAAEVWLLSNRLKPDYNMEEIVSTRSIIAEYQKESKTHDNKIMPVDIYKIAIGEKEGDKNAALKAFEFFGRGIGDAIANLVTIIDGAIVIGGGITGAQDLYMPAVFEKLTRSYKVRNGVTARPIQKVYNYSNENDRAEFLKPTMVEIKVHQSDKVVYYDPNPQVVITHSEIGASKAIQLGAYVFALNNLS